MKHAAVVSGLMPACTGLLFKEHDARRGEAIQQLVCRCQSNDSSAYYRDLHPWPLPESRSVTSIQSWKLHHATLRAIQSRGGQSRCLRKVGMLPQEVPALLLASILY